MSDILIGKGDLPVRLLGKYGNRHGLVAGATGTGKSVTLMVMAEGFSRLGVPVFMADVKGDIAGLAVAGTPRTRRSPRACSRSASRATPTRPARWCSGTSTASSATRCARRCRKMGPALMSRMLELNDVQSGVIDIAFKLADDQGLLLLDLDDLRALLNFASEKQGEIGKQYGLVSPQSVAAIQRALLRLEQDGGEQFFGEPALQLADLMRQDMSGRGVINLLAADQLILRPRLYSSFLLWLLSELFENAARSGRPGRAQAGVLLRRGAPAVRRLPAVAAAARRTGGAPDPLQGRGRVLLLAESRRHPRRRCWASWATACSTRCAPTPRATRRPCAPPPKPSCRTPSCDVAKVIRELGVGEALVSMLLDKGVPMPVERALIAPPRCRMGAITPEERAAVRGRSPVGGKYDTAVNRESAFEMLAKRAEGSAAPASAPGKGAPAAGQPAEPAPSKFDEFLWGTKRRQGAVEAAAKSATRTVANGLGRQLLRGILGSLLGGKKG